MNLLKNVKIQRVMNAVAAGTTDTQKGTIVDTQGYEGVMFVALLGDVIVNAVGTLKAAGSDANDTAQMTVLAGTAATGTATATSADNKALVLDVHKPQERYIEPQLQRATANIVIDGIIAILYGPGVKPTVHDASVLANALAISPEAA